MQFFVVAEGLSEVLFGGVEVTEYPGDAANRPACALAGRPASVAMPTSVQ